MTKVNVYFFYKTNLLLQPQVVSLSIIIKLIDSQYTLFIRKVESAISTTSSSLSLLKDLITSFTFPAETAFTVSKNYFFLHILSTCYFTLTFCFCQFSASFPLSQFILILLLFFFLELIFLLFLLVCNIFFLVLFPMLFFN